MFHLDDLQSIHLQEKRSQSGQETSSLQRTEQAPLWPFLVMMNVTLTLPRPTICPSSVFSSKTKMMFRTTLLNRPSPMMVTWFSLEWMDSMANSVTLHVPLSSMLSKRLERATVESTGRFAHGSSAANVTGVHRFQSFTVKIVGLFPFQKINSLLNFHEMLSLMGKEIRWKPQNPSSTYAVLIVVRTLDEKPTQWTRLLTRHGTSCAIRTPTILSNGTMQTLQTIG